MQKVTKHSITIKETKMKRTCLVIALCCVMVFAFAATAMADHSPLFYFNFQQGAEVTTSETFLEVFPASWNVSFDINNGLWALGTATPHSGYSQSTAKCSVCHAVHRAPTAGTSAFATKGEVGVGFGRDTVTNTIINTGTATTSSRYTADPWTAEASTQMLLRSTTARACIYCHVIETPSGKMYGGQSSLAPYASEGASGWGEFYAHTTGCTSCHAVHGANTFKGAGVDAKILKWRGVKNLGTIPLVVQPQVYGGNPALYTSQANMIAGSLSPSATAAGVTPLQAAVTAQCSICHASYAVGEETINANFLNAELFQPASWATANGTTTPVFVGSASTPVSVLPGYAGLTYTQPGGAGSPGSLIMAYKNHPLKAGGQFFKGSGAGALFTGSNNVVVSNTGSSVCQSCHNAPVGTAPASNDGVYTVQSFPHYTPGYYKFMAAQTQALFDTPATNAEVMLGRQGFYSTYIPTTFSRPGRPAVMNDGYCTKCHNTVGTDY